MVHSLGLKQLELVERAAIGVNDSGNIVFVARTEDETAAALKSHQPHSIIDLGSKFISPGFVDTHCHAPQYVFAGLGTGTPLLEWLAKYTFNYESQFKEVEFARKVYPKVVSQMLRQGSTTVSYFATIHLEATKALHEICVAAGQRALVGKVCMDRNAPPHYIESSTEESLASTKSFIEYCETQKSELVKPTITPRFAITCTEQLMKGLGDLASQHDCHIQSHLNENKGEIAFVGELFPGKSYTEVYRQFGLLNSKTIMAHCVHSTDAELDLMRECGASISHCPTSNSSMFSGLCHVRRAIEAGVSVGLGTDMAGGYANSLLTTLRDAINVSSAIQTSASDQASSSASNASNASNNPSHPSNNPSHPSNAGLSFQEAFFLATLGGAQALSLQHSIGNFVVGKSFDALVIDVNAPGSRIDCFGLETTLNLFEKYLYLGDDRNIEHVFVQGKRVHGSSSQSLPFTTTGNQM
jgi:guanine deaminase